MKRSPDLYDLIRSMSRSERRFFTLQMAHYGKEDKIYLRLFEAIAHEDLYDDEAILSHLGKQVTAKRLHVVKHYLYNLILRMLRNVQHSPQVDSEILTSIIDSNILVERQLFSQAMKILQRAAEKAHENERYALEIEILYRIRSIVSFVKGLENPQQLRYDLAQQAEDVSKLLHGYTIQQTIGSGMSVFLGKVGYVHDEEAREQFNLIAKEQYLSTDLESASTLSNVSLYYNRATVAFANQNFDKALIESKTMMEFVRNGLHLIGNDPVFFITKLNTFAADAMNKGDTKTVEEVFDEVDSIEQRFSFQPHIRFVLLKTIYILRVNYYIQHGKLEDAIHEIERIESIIVEFRSLLDPSTLSILYYNFALAYFYDGRYQDALDWLNTLLNEVGKKGRKDVEVFSRFMMLLAHIELGNLSYVSDYLLMATRRILRKNTIFLNYQFHFMNMIRDLQRTRTPEQILEVYKSTFDKITTDLINPVENMGYSIFDIHSWLQGRFTGKGTAHFMIQRNTKNQRIQ